MLRAIRHHVGKTQGELAHDIGVSQSTISLVERGLLGDLKIGLIERLVTGLDADMFIDIRYRGGTADRLIDRAHAALVDHATGVLRSAGWVVELEFSFNVYGERGSVDIIGWHAATRTLLIVEVKSVLTDLQATLFSLGRKMRLVPAEVRRAAVGTLRSSVGSSC